MLRYHDTEWGVPVHDDRKHFEFLLLEGAQAGLSWSIVLRKRKGYRRAFSDFDPARVARFTDSRIEKLTSDPAIIRNRLKIEAAVRNAKAFLAVEEEFGSFDAYCWRFVGGRPRQNRWSAMLQIPATSPESDAFSKDLKRRGFAFVGSTVIYAHMQAVGMVNDHVVDCFRHREVRRLSAVEIPKPKTVDEYLSRLSPDKRAALEKLREDIHAAAPRVEERISYGIPGFRLDGKMLVWIGAGKNHCAFHPGGVVPQLAAELEGYDTSKGTVRFLPGKPLPPALVRKMVNARIARNAGERSRPGRRVRRPPK